MYVLLLLLMCRLFFPVQCSMQSNHIISGMREVDEKNITTTATTTTKQSTTIKMPKNVYRCTNWSVRWWIFCFFPPLSLMVSFIFSMLYLKDGFFFKKKGNKNIIYICIFWMDKKTNRMEKTEDCMYVQLNDAVQSFMFLFLFFNGFICLYCFIHLFFDCIGLVNNHAMA